MEKLINASAFALFVSLSCVQCASFRHDVRSAFDVGVELCQLWGADQNKDVLGGLSVADFCALAENSKPFVDRALELKRMGAQRGSCSGYNR